MGVASLRAVDEDGKSGFDLALAGSSPDALLQPAKSWVVRGALDTKIDFIIRALEGDRPSL